MDSNAITAIATVFLVIVGVQQIRILHLQHRQLQLTLIEGYRTQWREIREHYASLVFIGRNSNEYYQLLDEKDLNLLRKNTAEASLSKPTVWALDAAKAFFPLLSTISQKILQNELSVSDVYSLFGTEFLRHCRPIRVLLQQDYHQYYPDSDQKHQRIRSEIQGWLIYHDGIRRRSLILIDLLWAEAARLEDLPPEDLASAAIAKLKTGRMNKKRLLEEANRLDHRFSIHVHRLMRFLNHAELSRFGSRRGLKKQRLTKLYKEWENRLLNR